MSRPAGYLAGGLATPIWTIPGGLPRLPELDRRHVAQRRVDPEIVVSVRAVRELGPELSRRAERLAMDELGLQYPVGRLVDGVVVGAVLGRQRPLYAEGLEHQVDLGVVELAAAVRAEYLDVRDGEGGRRERRLDWPGALPGPGGVADDLPVAGVDEQADAVPRGPDTRAGQVAAYMGARRPAAKAARDDVLHVGLVDRPGVHLEPLPAVCAGQAFSLMMRQTRRRLTATPDLPGDAFILREPYRPLLATWAAARPARRAGPRAHVAVRRPRDADEPALRRYGVAALVVRHGPHFRAYIGAACFRRRPPSGACGSRARAPGSGPARACGCPRRAASRSRLST